MPQFNVQFDADIDDETEVLDQLCTRWPEQSGELAYYLNPDIENMREKSPDDNCDEYAIAWVDHLLRPDSWPTAEARALIRFAVRIALRARRDELPWIFPDDGPDPLGGAA